MKSLFILMPFIIIGHTAVSQAFTIENVQSLYDLYNFEISRANALDIDRYSKVDGCPYLSKEFVVGEVIINDSVRYEKIPLRYNIFTDRMEYIDAQERVLEVNTSIHRFTFHFDDHHFRLVQYNDGGRMRRGLLELIVDGRTRLYRKYTVDIKAGTPPMGYQTATRDRFIRKNDQFLVAAEDKIPVLVTRRRDLIRKLEAVSPGINQYLKNNRVRMSSEQSLIDLIEYSNNQIN